MNNRKLVLGGVVIAAFLGFGMFSFQKSLTPYVSFAEARDAGRAVQVKGYPNHVTARIDMEKQAFCFTLRDDTGATMDVIYRGAKPGNFEQAESVVAIGHYEAGVLEADQLLVKCPSKYEAEYPDATEHPESIPSRGAVQFDAPPDSGGSQ